MIEFDPIAVTIESIIVKYFENGLKPSIKAEMDQNASYLNDYKELVAKAIRAKTKAGLWPSSYVRESDQQVTQGNQSAHAIAYKVQTQRAMKDHCKGESKAKASVPTFI